MFNVFLPKLLEMGSSGEERVKTLEENLWDVMIFTVGGTPGAIVSQKWTPFLFLLQKLMKLIQLGAWLVETPLRRRWSLALSTFTTAVFCLVFVVVESTWAVRTTTVVICLSATVRELEHLRLPD